MVPSARWARPTRAALLVVSALASSALAACGSSAQNERAEQADAVREDHTSEKLLARGRAFAEVGDLTRAQQYLAAALEEGADPEVALPLLIQVCVAERSYRVALRYAKPYLVKDPNNHRLRFVVATLYLSIGEVKKAQEELTRVANEAPDNALAHFTLGVLLRDDVADVVAADRHFREYLRIEPSGEHAEEARASLLKRVRDEPEP